MIRALIVDDEKRAREVLKKSILETGIAMQICAEASSVVEAREMLKMHQVDLVFLDIKMPGGSGFDLLDQMDDISFEIIFTTAYDEYTLAAIKCGALDYLLKPISITELKTALTKLVNKKDKSKEDFRSQLKNLVQFLGSGGNPPKKVPISSTQGTIFINTEDIIRCEASNNYTSFYLMNGKVLITSKTLKDYDVLLSRHGFFRSHRSHLINLDHVKEYQKGKSGVIVMVDGSLVELSEKRKSSFLSSF